MNQLIFVEQQPMQGREHPPQPGATVGREGCDINLADPEVSRRHAAIRVEGDRLGIEDLGSKNGTFVNGERIEGHRALSAGDEVRLGNTVWRVQPSAQATAIGDAPAAAAPPQVTKAREVPEAQPPAPQPPAAQPPAPQPPAPQRPAAPQPPVPARRDGSRGDVPVPDFQPSAIRRVVPPPGGPAAFQPQSAAGRQRGSAATRLGATVLATIVVALTAAAVIAYYVAEPFEDDAGRDSGAVIQTHGDALAETTATRRAGA